MTLIIVTMALVHKKMMDESFISLLNIWLDLQRKKQKIVKILDEMNERITSELYDNGTYTILDEDE